MYVVFFITSLKLKYIYASKSKHAEQTNGNKYMPNFTLFQNSADPCLKINPYFDFAISRLSLKKYPFFSKMGTSMIYTLVGSGGAGW